MKKEKKGFDDYGDIISGLPDAILCHILSFLPTVEAASTTSLAKRWKPLLAFVPNLDFDDSIYFLRPMTREKRKESSKSFLRFVDSVLALKAKEEAPLNRFHVRCEDSVDQHWVLGWIPKVLKLDVLDIDLYISSSITCNWRAIFHPLPSELFVSKTLVSLKIEFEDGVNIYVEGDVSLPKLKTLHLTFFQTDAITFKKLISGCHVLEELVLINLNWNWHCKYLGPYSVTVSIPTLKRLKFHRYEKYDEVNDTMSLSFETPNLVYLEYFDMMPYKCQVSCDSLVEARLGFRMTLEQLEEVCSLEEFEPKDVNNMKKRLLRICNVRILYLSDDILKILNYCSEAIPVFNNLMQLTIEPWLEWISLPALLNNCPNLETLVFDGMNHVYTERCDDEDGCLCNCPDGSGGRVVRNCLLSSPVKVLKFLKFHENRCYIGEVKKQLEQVKYFLETMPNLKQVTLNYSDTPEDEDVIEVCKQLQKLRSVASPKFKFQIISENLSLSSTMSTKLGRTSFSGFKSLR